MMRLMLCWRGLISGETRQRDARAIMMGKRGKLIVRTCARRRAYSFANALRRVIIADIPTLGEPKPANEGEQVTYRPPL